MYCSAPEIVSRAKRNEWKSVRKTKTELVDKRVPVQEKMLNMTKEGIILRRKKDQIKSLVAQDLVKRYPNNLALVYGS